MSARSTPVRRVDPPRSFEARIVTLDDDGRGLADVNGKPVLVDGALEGERVVIDVIRKRRGFDEAKLVEVIEPSAQRARPGCEYFDLCGGCRFQHLKPDAQRVRKEKAFRQALDAGGVPPPRQWTPPITGPDAGYRRKARLSVKFVPGKGGALVGFREKRGKFIADIQHCEVLVPSVGTSIHALRGLVTGLDARDRIPQIEIAVGDDDTALVVRHLDPLTGADQEALREYARSHGLSVYLQPGGPDSVIPLWPQIALPLRYRIPEFGLDFEFGPLDFVQVNATVNRALVSRAVSWLHPEASDRVLDLYCGIGNFSLPLSRRGAAVCGVEASPEMVSVARRNAERNGITSARFQVADLDNSEQAAAVLSAGWTAMLLDPPRSGAPRVMDQLVSPYPKRIVYVSCNPQSFARDASVLIHRHGFRLDRAGIVDMFLHTGHVEVVGLFSAGDQ